MTEHEFLNAEVLDLPLETTLALTIAPDNAATPLSVECSAIMEVPAASCVMEKDMNSVKNTDPLALGKVAPLSPLLKREILSTKYADSLPSSEPLKSSRSSSFHVRNESPDASAHFEICAYSSYINSSLAGFAKTDLAGYLPLDSDNFLPILRDGVILGYMLSVVDHQAIDVSKLIKNLDVSSINTPMSKVAYEVGSNHQLVLKSAKRLGIKLVNIGQEDILSMNLNLVLSLVWQIIRLNLTHSINLSSRPEIIRLCLPGEAISDFVSLTSEAILLRWVNFHLKNAGVNFKIANLSSDLSSSIVYSYVFAQVIPSLKDSNLVGEVQSIDGSTFEGKEKRAQKLLEALASADVNVVTTSADIANGHPRLNLCLVAEIFNRFIGIDLLTDQETKELIAERDSLLATVDSLQAELDSIRNSYSFDKRAWEATLVQERSIYSSKIRDLETHYTNQVEQWNLKYQMDIDALNKKCLAIQQMHDLSTNKIASDLQLVSKKLLNGIPPAERSTFRLNEDLSGSKKAIKDEDVSLQLESMYRSVDAALRKISDLLEENLKLKEQLRKEKMVNERFDVHIGKLGQALCDQASASRPDPKGGKNKLGKLLDKISR